LRKAKKVGNSDCQNIREKLDLYLDNELLVETNQSVLDHLGFCQECAAELESRIELRRLLQAALNISEDDERDRDADSRKRTQMALARERGRKITARLRWAALAASVLLALGVVYWRISSTPKPTNSSFVNTPTSQTPVLVAEADRDAVENHQVCALSYPPNWTLDGQRVARNLTPRFAPLIDVIGRNHASYQLIEGHICSYQQKKYAHLIFRGEGHTVSVFIENDEPGSKPKSSRSPEIDQATYKEYQVASVDTGLHHIFVVSDLPGAENLALANRLLPATLNFIHKMELSAS
jgi:anti-sigma factor RsiW